MNSNKFLILIAFFVTLPIFSMDRAHEPCKMGSRFAPYPPREKIKAITALAKLSLSDNRRKTPLRTLGRKPSDEEKASASALELELESDPLTI